jgi:F1F0 ATPase subunit 2
MNGWTSIFLALGGGAVVGAGFFAGLWWTVERLVRTRRPGLLLAGSFVLRMGFALVGFYLAARAGWQPLLACLLGFMVARLVVARWHRPRTASPAPEAPAP